MTSNQCFGLLSRNATARCAKWRQEAHKLEATPAQQGSAGGQIRMESQSPFRGKHRLLMPVASMSNRVAPVETGFSSPAHDQPSAPTLGSNCSGAYQQMSVGSQ